MTTAVKNQLVDLYKSEISGCRKCVDEIKEIKKVAETSFLFIPPRIEVGEIKYLFITMEPTDTWFDELEGGRNLLNDGFVGFYHGGENRRPFLFQFLVQRFLCNKRETYLITDMGKCSMPPNKDLTDKTRESRFFFCAPNLRKEIEITKPEKIFCLGNSVEGSIKKLKLIPFFKNLKYIKIDHYSKTNTGGSLYSLAEHNQKGFELFKKEHEQSLNDEMGDFIDKRISEIKADVKGIAFEKIEEALLKNKKPLTEAEWKVSFYYYSQFRAE